MTPERPSEPGARIAAALAHISAGRVADAEAMCRAIVATHPNQGRAWHLLGAIALQRGDADEAIACCRRALALIPSLAKAHNNLGSALTRQNRLDEAITALTRAITLDPLLASAHYNLGYALQRKAEYESALTSLRRAQTLKPDMVEIYPTLGIVYRALGRAAEAIESQNKALELQPDHPNAAFFRSLVFLNQGRFAEGWRDYLTRFSIRDTTLPLHRQPLPRDLNGMRILLVKDQGLGDEIFFLRFAPALKQRGAHVMYRTDSKIASMLRRLPFLDAVTDDIKAPSADLILSIGDLPYLLAMESVEDIPPSIRLRALPEHLVAQQAALAALGPPPYVGVTWRAGTGIQGSQSKSIAIDGIGAALRRANGTLVALQRAPEAGEIAALEAAVGAPVHDMTGLNDRLEEMLALLALLDDYVAVSNTNVHLRAAVGRGSRVLVPSPSEFRWMAAGSVSPWFPDCTVYRQEIEGSWDKALAALAHDLAPKPQSAQRGISL